MMNDLSLHRSRLGRGQRIRLLAFDGARTMTRGHSRLLLLAAALVLLAGCGTRVFHADFTQDRGWSVNTSPPTDPVGDAIILPPPPVHGGAPRAQISSTIEGFDGNALVFSGASSLAPLGPLSFVAVPVDPASRRYMANWRALRRYSGGIPPLYIDFENGAGVNLVRLEVFAGQYATTPRGGYRTVIGRFADETVHEVLIVVDKTTDTYSVVLFDEDGGIVGDAIDLALLSTAPVTRPRLVLSYAGYVSTRYYVDDVLITEECPDASGTLGECR